MGLLGKGNQAEEDVAATALTVDVDPREIPELEAVEGKLIRARRVADALPAEATAENKGQFATALEDLRNAKRDAEEARKQITRQFDGAKRRVKAHVDELVSTVSAAYESAADRLLELEAAERRADEEERRAEEAQRKAAQEEEDAKAEAEGRRHRHIPPPAPRQRPTGARSTSGAKASPVRTVKPKILDESQIPEEYWRKALNMAKINADVRAGVVIPGVEPYVEESVRVN